MTGIPQPQPHFALQAFSDWERDSLVEVTTGPTDGDVAAFVPSEKIRSYFTADHHENLNQILRAVFNSLYPPIDPESILVEHAAVFCILLRIGKGEYIEQFAGYEELSDRRLPFDQNHAPAELSDINDDPAFLQLFCDAQWMYCVPTFDKNMLNKRFGKQRLLPITHKERGGVEGLTETSIIKVYGPYNEMQSFASENIDDSNSNTFVLKAYTTKEGEALYRKEASGFRSVRGADGIIRFYGSYIHGDNFNIVLEHADKGSLEEYYQTETPPGRGKDIVKFWEGLFELIKGLKAIHSVREGHFNVRPKAVLVLESCDTKQFKFASYGIDTPKVASPDTSLDVNAATYGTKIAMLSSNLTNIKIDAPEVYTRDNVDPLAGSQTKVTWEADIWSLGCMYSEAAIWIADGYKGLLDYRKERRSQLRRASFKGGDSFHDGVHVLDAVLENHRDIEERLRRSDYITKDVLETMVDEMLWEEDRPSAKVLLRKAEIVLARANKGLSSNNSDQSSQTSRPSSRQGRSNLPPRPPIPTQPLPSLPPHLPPRMSSIAERHHPLNVERWRSQVGLGPQSRSSQMSTTSSNANSPIVANPGLSRSGSTTDLEKDLAESISSWQMRDSTSNGSDSPITSFTSNPSANLDVRQRLPSQQRPRTERNKPSYELKYTSSVTANGTPYVGNYEPSEGFSTSPSRFQYDAYAANGLTKLQIHGNAYRDLRASNDASLDLHPVYRRGSQAGSRMSEATTYSIPIQNDTPSDSHGAIDEEGPPSPIPPKSPRRLTPQGVTFTLFPTPPENSAWSTSAQRPLSTRKESATTPQVPSENLQPQQPQPQSPAQEPERIPRFVPSMPSTISTVPGLSMSDYPSTPVIHLSLDTCLEWKKVHKKAKRNKPPPPLSGASMLARLSDREHTFILDDSISMSAVWPDVKNVFEALSYVIKPMAPDGTELYFTNSYDSYRRKDTADLCKLVQSKKLIPPVNFGGGAGIRGVAAQGTNIAHRLHIQLEDYKVRLQGIKVFAGPAANKRKEKDKVRPASFYVLTNGSWSADSVAETQRSIADIAEYLASSGMNEGQVAVNFISFAETRTAEERIEEVVGGTYALDIAATTPWQGNVLKMLLGSVNPHLDPSITGPRSEESSGRESRSSGRLSIAGGKTGSVREKGVSRTDSARTMFRSKAAANSIVSELAG